MKKFGPDYYNISDELTEEELLIQQTAHEFVQNEFIPVINEHFEQSTFPMELVSKLGELGFMGSALPVESGGAGVSNVAYGLILHELERGDSGLRSFASVQGSLVMYPIHAFGSVEQKEKWLPGLGKGELVGCFGLTEPNYGSNAGGMATTAKRNGDGWVINGSKMWITNGSIADVAVVWAKDDDGIVRGFLLEKGMDGYSSNDIHGKLSLRASITSELAMVNVQVPDSARLPGVEGMKGPLSCLTQARYGIAWGMTGCATDCYQTALNYAKERKQFSKPIAGYQLTQAKFTEMLTRITEAQLMVLRLGRMKDAGTMKFHQVSMAKRNNCAMARDIAKTAREILGANGVTLDYSPIRHLANIESVFTYEGLFAGILYLLVYIFTTFSVFYIFLISRLRQVKSYYLVDFNSFNSLKLINPFLVFILCINLFSMAGIPPLTGFFSKYYLFLSLVEINNIKLLFCLIILSLISTYYYIRPINLLVFSNNVKPKFFEEINSFSCLLIFFIYVVNSFMIIQPRFILDLVQSLIFFN